MALNLGRLKLFLDLHTLGAPDDYQDVIMSFIDESCKSLDVPVLDLRGDTL